MGTLILLVFSPLYNKQTIPEKDIMSDLKYVTKDNSDKNSLYTRIRIRVRDQTMSENLTTNNNRKQLSRPSHPAV